MKIIRRETDILHGDGNDLIVANNLIKIGFVSDTNNNWCIQAQTVDSNEIRLLSFSLEYWSLAQQHKLADAALEDILNWLTIPESKNCEHNIYTIKTVEEYARLAEIETPQR